MGETRVDLHHLLEDLRDAYPGSIQETILTEIVANALDSGATEIRFAPDAERATLTVIDNGSGMQRRQLARYHDIATSTKTKGRGIGFAGVGIKLGLLISERVVTETRRGKSHVATTWHLSSKRRAPWKWIDPLGLLDRDGTAIRLVVQNALDELLDPGFIRETLVRHFEPLFDDLFSSILARQYPAGVRFLVGDQLVDGRVGHLGESATIAAKLPRHRKVSALGYVFRQSSSLPADQRGIAISTFGKVIKRGWDWVGLSPAHADRIGGLVEVPDLAACLTLNKNDFLHSGKQRSLYLAYRKAIQTQIGERLDEWGALDGRSEDQHRRAARPVERDLEKVLVDLADHYPAVSTLVERRAGGQRRLPLGIASDEGTSVLPVGAPEPAEPIPADEGSPTAPPEEQPERPETRVPDVPPATVDQPAKPGPRRPARLRLQIRFESRPGDPELARLVETTVWVNESHPAYKRADAQRSLSYHVALATAFALARLAVEPAAEHEFVREFLVRWGEEHRTPRKRRSPRRQTRS